MAISAVARGRPASTGAFNCRYLEARMPKLIARCRAARKPIAVLMIYVDHGHASGNHVLKEIVNQLRPPCVPRIWWRERVAKNFSP